MANTPTVGRVVHYVAYGTPGGEYPAACRAAVITVVNDDFNVGLAVLNPTGQFFNPSNPFHSGDPAETAPGAHCNGGDRAYPGGSWHWPEIA